MNQFINATIFTGDEWLTNASVRTANGRIQEILTDSSFSNQETAIDIQGDYLIPGLV